MTDRDLARRAVACKGWRWLPGMRWTGSLPENTGRLGEVFGPVPGPVGLYLPDLTDPATLGCLLALVREAWGRPGAVCSCLPSDALGWFCCGQYGTTEVEALVAALEDAP